MTNISDKDLELLSKLEALRTGRGATEGEMQNAAAAMQRILFKYNLDMSAVESLNFGKDGKSEKPQFEREYNSIREMARKYNKSNRPNSREWIFTVAAAVARYNFCRALTSESFLHVTFIGKPENVAAVKSIWAFIVEQIGELREVEYKAAVKAKKTYGTDSRIWKRNFADGAAMRVSSRLWEEWNKLQQEFAESKALIVVNDTALEKFVDEITGGKTLKDRKLGNRDGFSAGYAAGERIALKNHTRLE